MNFQDLNKIVCTAIDLSKNREELWCNILKSIKPKYACEIGVWKGEFAKILLSNIPSIKKYTMVDPWKNLKDWNKPANFNTIEFNKIRDEALENVKKFHKKTIEFRLPTKQAANKIKNSSLDFIYIDGDHTLRGITIDLITLLPKIKKNGLIGGDDFTKNIWQHGNKYDPTQVFPYAVYFSEANNLKIFTLPFNQFLIFNDADKFEIIDYANYLSLPINKIYNKPIANFISPRKILPTNLKKLIKKIFCK